MPEYPGNNKQRLPKGKAILSVLKGLTSHEWSVTCPSESAELYGFKPRLWRFSYK